MPGKLLLIIGIIPVAVSFFLAQYFGKRRFQSHLRLKSSVEDAVRAVLEDEKIKVKVGRPLWAGSNPLKSGVYTVDKKKAESKDLFDIAELAHSAGLAHLSIAHEKSVLYYYKIQRFAAIFPAFVILVAVMGKLAGKFHLMLCFGIASTGLGLASLACLFQLLTLREAAKRAVYKLEKQGFYSKMSEQEELEKAIYGITYIKLLPACLHVFLPGSKKPSEEK